MAVFSGTAGSNNLRGTTARDTLAGHSGDDWIDGSHGADLAIGGPGADTFIWDEDRNSGSPTLDQYIGGNWNDYYDPNPYGDLSGGDKLILGASAGAGGFRVFFNTTEEGSVNDAYGNRLNFSGIERLETNLDHGARAGLRPRALWIGANADSLSQAHSFLGDSVEQVKQMSLKWAMIIAVVLMTPLAILWHIGAMKLPKGELDDEGDAVKEALTEGDPKGHTQATGPSA